LLLHVEQVPLKQTWPELHGLLQPLQCDGSFFVFVSQPFVSLLPSQSRNPETQVPLQTPAAQVRVAMLLLEQDWQPPHEFGSVAKLLVLRSQPFDCLLPSQST